MNDWKGDAFLLVNSYTTYKTCLQPLIRIDEAINDFWDTFHTLHFRPVVHWSDSHTAVVSRYTHTHSIRMQVYDCADSIGTLFLASDRLQVSILMYPYCICNCLLIQRLIACVHHPRFYNTVAASALSPIGSATYVMQKQGPCRVSVIMRTNKQKKLMRKHFRSACDMYEVGVKFNKVLWRS